QSFDCLLRLSVVCHLNECKPARQPGVTIHDDMDLHHLSVGFEHLPKLLVRHLRTQVSNIEVFHDGSPTKLFDSRHAKSSVKRMAVQARRRVSEFLVTKETARLMQSTSKPPGGDIVVVA